MTDPNPLPKLSFIVAVAQNGAIGKNNDLLWHLGSDLKRFKQLTMGHPVVMGRRTWDSLPKKPLPGRQNIVMTNNPDFTAEGATVVHSVNGLFKALKGTLRAASRQAKTISKYHQNFLLLRFRTSNLDLQGPSDWPFHLHVMF